MNNGHLTDHLLNAYAAGSASEGLSLVAAAHLTFCAACRAEVAAREALAGVLMADAELLSDADGDARDTAPTNADADFDALLNRLDEADDTPPQNPVQAGPLPRPVAQEIGVGFDDIPWRFRLPGVYEYEFARKDGEEISLLKVMPGASIPRHTHEADELTVVFEGELIDGDRCYRAGDLAVADPSVDHNPRAGGDSVCICLAVLSGGLRFTGPFGRALNLFT